MWIYLLIGFICGISGGFSLFMWLAARFVSEVQSLVTTFIDAVKTFPIPPEEVTRADG